MDLKMLVILVGLHVVYFIASNVDSLMKRLRKENETSKVSGI